MISTWVLQMSDMRGERLQVMLSPEDLTTIDDFRFRHRMPTRAAAVRELLKMGLAAPASNGGGMKSSSYGVFDRGPDGHTQGGAEPEAAESLLVAQGKSR
jgi:hypothetical protein